MPGARGMTLGSGRHVFHAVVDNLHRPSRFHGQQRGVAGDHRGIFFFAAKGPARLGLHHANAFRRQAGERYQSFEHVEGALHGTPDGQPSRVAGLCDHSIGFNVQLLLRAGAVFSFDDPGGVRPCLVYLPLFYQEVLEDIIFAPDDQIAALAFFNGMERGRRFIADVHCRYRTRQGMAIGVRQQQIGSSGWLTTPSARQG